MNGFIDIHHHLIWGMDDGPSTVRKSVSMMHAASKDGISVIIATPHASPGMHEFDIPTLLRRVGRLNQYSREHRLGIVVLPGCEIMYTQYAAQQLLDRRIPTLASSEYILVEFDIDDSYNHIYNAMRVLSNGGYVPIIAHVERYQSLTRDPELIRGLKENFHARVQMNCSTVIRGGNRQLRKFIVEVLENGIVDFVATDSHNTRTRATCMQDCYNVLYKRYSPGLAARLTGKNQAAIVSGR